MAAIKGLDSLVTNLSSCKALWDRMAAKTVPTTYEVTTRNSSRWSDHTPINIANNFFTLVALRQNWDGKVNKHSNDMDPCDLEKTGGGGSIFKSLWLINQDLAYLCYFDVHIATGIIFFLFHLPSWYWHLSSYSFQLLFKDGDFRSQKAAWIKNKKT